MNRPTKPSCRKKTNNCTYEIIQYHRNLHTPCRVGQQRKLQSVPFSYPLYPRRVSFPAWIIDLRSPDPPPPLRFSQLNSLSCYRRKQIVCTSLLLIRIHRTVRWRMGLFQWHSCSNFPPLPSSLLSFYSDFPLTVDEHARAFADFLSLPKLFWPASDEENFFFLFLPQLQFPMPWRSGWFLTRWLGTDSSVFPRLDLCRPFSPPSKTFLPLSFSETWTWLPGSELPALVSSRLTWTGGIEFACLELALVKSATRNANKTIPLIYDCNNSVGLNIRRGKQKFNIQHI